MTCPPPRSPLFPYTTLFRSSNTIRSEQFFLHDACGISVPYAKRVDGKLRQAWAIYVRLANGERRCFPLGHSLPLPGVDRKSTRLNSSHVRISYAVICLNKNK